MRTETSVHSDLAIPPGEYLEEVLLELGISKDELALRMDRPAAKLSAIYKGAKAITAETALQLERVLGIPAHVWTGLETEYRLVLQRQRDSLSTDQIRAEAPLVTKFCYRELVRIGEVDAAPTVAGRIRTMQEFFGVTSLRTVLGLKRYQAVFRLGRAGRRSPEAVAAWLRVGERRAHQTPCAAFDKGKLRDALGDLRAMTRHNPARTLDALQARLACCGVALVVCPHFPKTQAHGATFMIGSGKAVLMVTFRGRWSDIFWFSLFHEIGHLLLHDRRTVVLEDGAGGPMETDADAFAANALIDPDALAAFLRARRFRNTDTADFARRVGIHPGIVIGRLQHEGILRPDQGNALRSRYGETESRQ